MDPHELLAFQSGRRARKTGLGLDSIGRPNPLTGEVVAPELQAAWVRGWQCDVFDDLVAYLKHLVSPPGHDSSSIVINNDGNVYVNVGLNKSKAYCLSDFKQEFAKWVEIHG